MSKPGRKAGQKVIRRKLTIQQLAATFPQHYKIPVNTTIYNMYMEQNEADDDEEILEPTLDEEMENSEDMIEVPDVPEVEATLPQDKQSQTSKPKKKSVKSKA